MITTGIDKYHIRPIRYMSIIGQCYTLDEWVNKLEALPDTTDAQIESIIEDFLNFPLILEKFKQTSDSRVYFERDAGIMLEPLILGAIYIIRNKNLDKEHMDRIIQKYQKRWDPHGDRLPDLHHTMNYFQKTVVNIQECLKDNENVDERMYGFKPLSTQIGFIIAIWATLCDWFTLNHVRAAEETFHRKLHEIFGIPRLL